MLDINVVLDVFQKRSVHYDDSAACLSRIVEGIDEGFLAAHAITTVYYVLRRHSGRSVALEATAWLLDHLNVFPCDGTVARRALRFDGPDFEDGIVALSALDAGCDYILTRNAADFRNSTVSAISPSAYLRQFTQN